MNFAVKDYLNKLEFSGGNDLYKKLMKEIEKLKIGKYPVEEYYRVYGRCQMARELEKISKDEFMKLNNEVIAKGINDQSNLR